MHGFTLTHGVIAHVSISRTFLVSLASPASLAVGTPFSLSVNAY